MLACASSVTGVLVSCKGWLGYSESGRVLEWSKLCSCQLRLTQFSKHSVKRCERNRYRCSYLNAKRFAASGEINYQARFNLLRTIALLTWTTRQVVVRRDWDSAAECDL